MTIDPIEIHCRYAARIGGNGKVLSTLLLLTVSLGTGFAKEQASKDQTTAGPWVNLALTEKNWETCNFGGDGELEFEEKRIVLGEGDPLTGIRLKKPFPKDQFEVQMEAIRLTGLDFFVGLTFPVADSHCSLILGGWAGGIAGLSSIDGYDASDNPTTVFTDYDNDRWYKVRVVVTDNRVAAWVDGEKLVDQEREGFKFGIRGEMDSSLPFGISAFQCKVAYRNIRYRSLKPKKPNEANKAPKQKTKTGQ